MPDDIWEGVGQARRTWRQGTASHGGRIGLSVILIFYLLFISNITVKLPRFLQYCDQSAQHMSNPTVMKMERAPDGRTMNISQHLEGFFQAARSNPTVSFATWPIMC